MCKYAVGASMLSSVCVALAADVSVDNYERVDMPVTNGAATVDGSVFYATRGVALEKTGADTLTFPTASVQTRQPFTLNVLEGDVVVTNGTAPALEQPVCMQTAALWFDASQEDNLVSPDGAANGEVARWYDVREQKDEEGNWGRNTTAPRRRSVSSPTKRPRARGRR